MSVPAATKLENVYTILSKTYAAFGEADDEWPAYRLSDTPFRSLVSVSLSTMTTSKRTVAAATALYEKVSTPQELLALGDDELTALCVELKEALAVPVGVLAGGARRVDGIGVLADELDVKHR